MIKSYKTKTPTIHPSAFIAENAAVIGSVKIAENASVWFGVTIRGDINEIEIGRDTNIQDNSVVHVDSVARNPEFGATRIGDRVTIGHGAIIHACTIEDDCLIGMGAIILSGAKVGKGSIIAAGALVLERQEVPPNSIVMGAPGVVRGATTDERLQQIRSSAVHYVELAKNYKVS